MSPMFALLQWLRREKNRLWLTQWQILFLHCCRCLGWETYRLLKHLFPTLLPEGVSYAHSYHCEYQHPGCNGLVFLFLFQFYLLFPVVPFTAEYTSLLLAAAAAWCYINAYRTAAGASVETCGSWSVACASVSLWCGAIHSSLIDTQQWP